MSLSHKISRRAVSRTGGGNPRRGVILLVVLALLAMFTLMALTLVLATAQARLTSLNSARAQRSSTPPEQLLSRSFHDLARGTTNKRSPIQAHGLVEDLYGSPLFIGQVSSAPATLGAGAGGQLLQMNYSALTSPPSTTVPYQLPTANHVFTGLVITMRDGAARNRSARIVGDNVPYIPAGSSTLAARQLITTTFESFGSADGGAVMPALGDSFVINGRPFSGTGLGFQMASFTNQVGPFASGNNIYNPLATPAAPNFTNQLDALDPTPYLLTGVALSTAVPSYQQFFWPYALLPNHAHFTPQNALLSSPLTAAFVANPMFVPNGGLPVGGGWYTDPGGPGAATMTGIATTPYIVLPGSAAAPGGANEPYDAVDFQNMFLAMHYFDTNVLPPALMPPGVRHPQVLTPVPSFHRPELVAYWSQYFPTLATASPQLLMELRRKIMLRPEPADQQFLPTQNLSGTVPNAFDYREPFTDLNGNAYYDLGEPFLDLNGDTLYTPGDLDFAGKRFNPITGPYCIYHEPTTNREIWVLENPNPNPQYAGPTGDWDVDNDGDGLADSIWMDLGYDPEAGPDGKLYKPLFAILCIDMDGKLNLNAHGNIAQVDPQRYPPMSVSGPFAVGGGATSGSLAVSTAASRRFTFGDGYGPAEVNLEPLLERQNALGGTLPTPLVLQYYQQLLQGTYLPSIGANPPRYVEGRNGEVDNPNLALAPGVSNPLFPGVLNPTDIVGGPMPGKTLQFDPITLYVNDPLNQALEFLRHPYLIATAFQPPNTASYFFDFITPNFLPTPLAHIPSGHGTPYNLYGRGATLLDLRGQPYYAGTNLLPWMAPVINPVTGNITPDTVDDPYELNLMQSAQREGLVVNAAGALSRIDQPFTPEEVMRLLRIHDVDAQALPSRLDDLIPINSATMKPVAGLSLSTPEHRLAVTSDSWDLPVPGVTATDAQMVGVAGTPGDLTALTNPMSNPANPLSPVPYQQSIYNAMPTSIGGMGLVDLMRARIMIRNNWSAQQADVAIFGSEMMGLGNDSVQPLLAPELIQGMRINVNRALGNGMDDNLNGIADDQTEVLAGELLFFPLASGGNISIALDLNNDGVLPALDGPYYRDTRSRQLLARHLYVTMMLLIDDLQLQGQIFQPTTPVYGTLLTIPTPAGPATPPYPAQQVAYLIAQWAINVVDFRDPDAIMTPFEFDLSPFTNDDGLSTNGTWDVDDIVTPSVSPLDPWTGAAPSPVPTVGFVADDAAAWRGLVFGCERPELLITETMAWHDRGTDDTASAGPLMGGGADTYTGVPGGDTTYDQVRRPRGSLIVELFNPNSPLSAPQADLLQGANGAAPPTAAAGIPSTGGVNLTQYVQGPGAPAALSPVWRLAIAYSPSGYDTYTGAPMAAAGVPPLDPRVPTIPPGYIHRAVYFAPIDPTGATSVNPVTDVPPGRCFYPNAALLPLDTPVIVQPNAYALIGPGVMDPTAGTTMPNIAALHCGARNKTGDTTVGPSGKKNDYYRYLQLLGTGVGEPVGVYNNYATGPAGGPGGPVPPYTATLPQANIKNVVSLPIGTLYLTAAGTPALPAAATRSLRLSISEPELGYPLSPTATSPPQLWDDGFYYLTGTGATGPYPNIPFDNTANTSGVVPNPNVGAPDGTILAYTTVYLQRLANPLAQWDLNANPYITVDSMPIDLTKYTGEASPVTGGPTGGAEPPYGGAGPAPVLPLRLDSRSRGQITTLEPAAPAPAAADAPNVWTPASTAPTLWTIASSIAAPMQYTTLGYLNQTYWMSSAGTSTGNASSSTTPTGWYAGFYSPLVSDANAASRLASLTGIPPTEYYGDPILPFPWLTWNNRPFVSQYELMLVPSSSPSSLLSDFALYGYVHNSYTPAGGSAVDQWNLYPGGNPYNPPSGNNPLTPAGTPPPLAVPLNTFQHLLNFYDSAPTGTARLATNPTPANFFRIFEYLDVPSPFTGTQKLLNPAAFSQMGTGLHWFHPPFNWLPEYREPGKVNLNTVFDPVVFQGLMDEFSQWQNTSPGVPSVNSWQNLWHGLVDTRRGFSDLAYIAGAPVPIPNNGSMLPNLTLFRSPTLGVPTVPILPTYFANAFRPEGAGILQPPVSSVAFPLTTMQQSPLQGHSINTTMLRSIPPAAYPASPAGTAAVPLFSAAGFDLLNQPGSTTYVATTGTVPARQAARNAYFQYQAQQRLGNLVTNRSNVFAVWITVGYFEALPTLPSAANPDGYQLGPERGSDTGTQDRHRAFYMFDRSIPMGFQRGEDLNVDNGILIERMIE